MWSQKLSTNNHYTLSLIYVALLASSKDDFLYLYLSWEVLKLWNQATIAVLKSCILDKGEYANHLKGPVHQLLHAFCDPRYLFLRPKDGFKIYHNYHRMIKKQRPFFKYLCWFHIHWNKTTYYLFLQMFLCPTFLPCYLYHCIFLAIQWHLITWFFFVDKNECFSVSLLLEWRTYVLQFKFL